MSASDGEARPPRYLLALEAHLGHVVLGATAVRDDELRRRRRRSLLWPIVMAAFAALLAGSLGPGWLLVAAPGVVYLVANRRQRLLVAMPIGLAVVEVVRQRVSTVARFGLGAAATLTLDSSEPWVGLRIEPHVEDVPGPRTDTDSPPPAPVQHQEAWEGHIDGTAIKQVEAQIQAGGGETSRRVT